MIDCRIFATPAPLRIANLEGPKPQWLDSKPEAAAEINVLLPAILDRAFKGEL